MIWKTEKMDKKEREIWWKCSGLQFQFFLFFERTSRPTLSISIRVDTSSWTFVWTLTCYRSVNLRARESCFKFPNHFSNHQGKAEDGLTFWNKSWGNINRTHIVSHYSNWQRSSSKSKIKLLHLFLLNKKQNIISKQMTSGYEQKINNT